MTSIKNNDTIAEAEEGDFTYTFLTRVDDANVNKY